MSVDQVRCRLSTQSTLSRLQRTECSKGLFVLKSIITSFGFVVLRFISRVRCWTSSLKTVHTTFEVDLPLKVLNLEAQGLWPAAAFSRLGLSSRTYRPVSWWCQLKALVNDFQVNTWSGENSVLLFNSIIDVLNIKQKTQCQKNHQAFKLSQAHSKVRSGWSKGRRERLLDNTTRGH